MVFIGAGYNQGFPQVLRTWRGSSKFDGGGGGVGGGGGA